jgi:hypothetical protein
MTPLAKPFLKFVAVPGRVGGGEAAGIEAKVEGALPNLFFHFGGGENRAR